MYSSRSNGLSDQSNGQRPRVEAPRPYKRYSISPIRREIPDSRRSRTPVKMYADVVERQAVGRGDESSWRGRPSISPRRGRSRSFERRRSRSIERRGRSRNYSPRARVASRSPPITKRRYSRSKSRTPPRSWRQQFSPQPQVRFRYSRSRSPVRAATLRSVYAINSRRSRSGSNMDISSNDGSPSAQMFKSTFRPVEQKKTKKIKISVPKDLPREESLSPEVSEVDFRGYKIRNAPDVDAHDSSRRRRWDADQSSLPVPSTEEILKRQGVPNPDEALKRLANLPTMESKFKSQVGDDDAVKEQLRLLEQEKRMQKLRENLPPTIGLPAPLAFSAIGKTNAKNSSIISTTSASAMMPTTNTLISSQPSTLPLINVPQVASYPQPGFPFGMQGQTLMPQMGLPPNFSGPPPTVPTSMAYGLPPPGFISQPGLGMLPQQMAMSQNFNSIPPMVNMPPVSSAFQNNIPKFNLTNIGPPPMQQMQPQVDPTEAIFKARADLYRRDLSDIRSIPELIKYVWSQGFDAIPADDPPLLFNEILKDREGILGASFLYQIICFGHPELETFFCSMCNHWTTVSEMFNHLTASMHRMNFLARNYKLFHTKAVEHTDHHEQDKFLDFICKKVWKIDGSGSCVNRMRCILNIDVIKQVWPNYFEYLDSSWKMLGSKDALDEILNSGRPQSSNLDEQPVNAQYDNKISGSSSNGKIMIKPSLNTVLNRGPIGELEKVNERSRRDSRERKRSRSRKKSSERSSKRSRSRRSRSSSRKREKRRSRSRSPRHSKSSKGDKNDWERKTNEFITRINNDGISSALNSVSSPKHSREDTETTRTELRRKENTAAEDQARHTRKALGALLEIQRLHDEKGSISRSMIYAVAADMGLSEQDVHQSKILKQGLENMNVIKDSSEQKVSLESLGIAQLDLKKLLSSVSSASKRDEASMVYPEVGSDNVLVNSIRTAIYETRQKMIDPKNDHMRLELQRRLEHLELKLSQELGVAPIQRSNMPINRGRPMPAGAQQMLPGAWRNRAMATTHDNGMAQRANIRSDVEETAARKDESKFDPKKVEQEWTDYFMKDPSKIDEINNATDDSAKEQYDSYYGPGTFVAFVAARRRAAQNATHALAAAASKSRF